MIDLEEYKRIMADRPRKATPEDVNYRQYGRSGCVRCLHYFERVLDGFSVCEIMRSEETDEHGVDPMFICDFWTQTGNTFPFLDKRDANT